MNKFSKLFLTVFCIFLSSSLSWAESIQFKNGKLVEGIIVSQTDEYIKVDTGLSIEVTYYLDEIDSIDGVEVMTQEVPRKELELYENQDFGIKIGDTEIISDEKGAEIKGYIDSVGDKMKSQWDGVQENLQVNDNIEKLKDHVGESFGKMDDVIDDHMIDVKQSMEGWEEKYPEITGKFDESAKLLEKLPGDQQSPLFFVIIILFIYNLVCYPLMRIAKHLGTGSYWMAWIPIFQFVLMTKMAQKPLWWFLLYFVPVLGVIINVILWIKICGFLRRPFWFGFIILVPVLNLLFIWYLALSGHRRFHKSTFKG